MKQVEYLAHVGAFVLALHVGQHQLPVRMKEENVKRMKREEAAADELPNGQAVMTHRYPRIVGDDVRVDGLDGFGVRLDPADFVAAQVVDVARQDGLVAHRHRQVGQGPLEFRNVPTVCH
jgi:hypothetical protein